MKMTIKEAGRYANFLEEIRREISMLVYDGIESKLVSITETHKKSDAYKEAEDEIIEVEFEDKVDVKLDLLTNILDDVIKEKILIANAIANAKREINIEINEEMSLDLDAAIEYAKLLRAVSRDYFNPLIDMEERKYKTSGKAYAFNVEGNQTPYVYEIETIKKLKFDKADIIKKDKENRMLADTISQEIDKAMSDDVVEFETRYSYLDSLKDIIEQTK